MSSLMLVLLIFGGITLILTDFLIFHFYDIQIHHQLYTVTFDGKSTFSDNGLTALVSRAANDSQCVSIYGIANPNSTILTDLVDESGRKIQSKDKIFEIIKHNETSKQNTTTAIFMSVTGKGSGSFNGYIIVTSQDQSNVSIPVTVATPPIIGESIILVIIGIMISVCIWEIILYERNLQKESSEPELESKVGITKTEAKKANEKVLKAIARLETSNLTFVAKQKALRPIIDYYSLKATIKETEAASLQKQLAENQVALIKYQARNKSPLKSVGRVLLPAV